MARSVVKTRQKKSPQDNRRNRVSAIKYVVNSVIGKYYMIGDRHTLPSSFNFSELHMKLKGEDLRIAKQLIIDFMFGETRDWVVMFYFFFDCENIIEVVPVECVLNDVTMASGADYLTELAEQVRTQLCESEEHKDLMDGYLSYGYYYTWLNEDGLNFDKMDADIITGLMKVAKDFTRNDRPIVTVNGFDVVDQVAKEKFSLTAKDVMETDFVEITEELITSLSKGN